MDAEKKSLEEIGLAVFGPEAILGRVSSYAGGNLRLGDVRRQLFAHDSD
jgi:hypothetical protein